MAAAKAAAKAAPRDLRATKAAAAQGGGAATASESNDSEEDNDMMTISHIRAHKVPLVDRIAWIGMEVRGVRLALERVVDQEAE